MPKPNPDYAGITNVAREIAEREAAPVTVVPDPTGITFARSTTTTTVIHEADGDIKTSVEHVAIFEAEPGSIPDQMPRYGRQIFRPTRMTVRWERGQLARVHLSGPRVLKAGLSETERRDTTFDRPWFGDGRPFNRYDLPAVVQLVVAAYERDVAVNSIDGGQ